MMRIVLSILLIFLAPAAVSQTPPEDPAKPSISLETPDGFFNLYVIETPNEDGEIEKRIVVPPEFLQNEKLMDSFRKQGLTPIPQTGPSQPRCNVDYSDIDAEQNDSNARLRAMRGKVVPLQHQYEQELYYRERREKRYEEKCGKRQRSYANQRGLDMTLKACEAIEVECKPVKHW